MTWTLTPTIVSRPTARRIRKLRGSYVFCEICGIGGMAQATCACTRRGLSSRKIVNRPISAYRMRLLTRIAPRTLCPSTSRTTLTNPRTRITGRLGSSSFEVAAATVFPTGLRSRSKRLPRMNTWTTCYLTSRGRTRPAKTPRTALLLTGAFLRRERTR